MLIISDLQDNFTPQRKISQVKMRFDVKLFLEYFLIMENDVLSTKEVSEIIGISVRGVQKMIEEGRLKATRVGRDYVIFREALDSIERKSNAGRPPKTKTKSNE